MKNLSYVLVTNGLLSATFTWWLYGDGESGVFLPFEIWLITLFFLNVSIIVPFITSKR